MIFKNEYTIGLEDIGRSNKATNKAILAIMEDVGSLHSATIGFGVNDVERTQRAWVILDWKVRVIKRPVYNEKIEANTWASGLDKAFAYRNFELKDKNGETLAIGSSRWILMNLELRRPERLKPELAELFHAEPDHSIFPEGDPNFRDIPKASELLAEEEEISYSEYQVERRDIDGNRHMHNLNYLDVAYEALPEEIYNQGECANIRISYKKEIVYGEKVQCAYRQIDDHYYVVMSNEEHINAFIILN